MNISKVDLGRHLSNDLMRRIEISNDSIVIKCNKCDSNFYCGFEIEKRKDWEVYELIIRKIFRKNCFELWLSPIEELFDKLPESIIIQCNKRDGEELFSDEEPLFGVEDEDREFKLLRKMNKSLKELQKTKNPNEEEIRKLERLKMAINDLEQRRDLKYEHRQRDEALRCQRLEKAEKFCLPRNNQDIEEVVKACLKIIGGER